MSIKSSITEGAIYSSWTVLGRTSDRCRVRFICQCSCGIVEDVLAQNLTNGRSRQCRSCANHKRTHLMDMPRDLYARLYHQARGAIRRCTDTTNLDYCGRGIVVYSEWLASIKVFVEYLITLPGCNDNSLVLNRINNDGNYEPGNIRFATWSESNYNRRLPTRKEI